MSEYSNRLYIRWTHPSANYGRWIDEEKYEIHSIGANEDNSIGSLPSEYYNIRLDYIVLQKMIEYQIDNLEWYNYLCRRSGVYLIYDRSTGEQYIGSASGENGFWGRWSDYVDRKDGNILLKDKDYNNFQFCILWETLIHTSKQRIIEVECEMKKNLGTRVLGLNDN